ncbi:MAG: putative bifunctional diguanylate cyclase/phosphodiesterase [Egibacteraceae bacterium]
MFAAYVLVQAVVAFLATASFVLFGQTSLGTDNVWPALVLGVAVIVTENVPLRLSEQGQITVSTTFAFAAVISVGTLPALVALVLAGVIHDLGQRKRLLYLASNAANYSLTTLAAGSALALFGPNGWGEPAAVRLDTLPALLAAGVAFFAVNLLLMAITLTLLSSSPSLGGGLKGRGLASHGWTTGVLLTLAPVVAIVVERSVWLLPLLFVPMAAVYKSAAIYLERERQALYDELTGLPNRVLFLERVRQTLSSPPRPDGFAAVLVVDLDRFREVNETLGHAAGDWLLQQIAARLEGELGPSDTLARLGTDEFGVLLCSIGSVSRAQLAAEHLRTVVEQALEFGEVVLRVEATIGLTLTPDHGEDPETLLRQADTAMFGAKRAQVGIRAYSPEEETLTAHRMLRQANTAVFGAKRAQVGIRVYSPEEETLTAHRMTLMANLGAAIERRQLQLHYQPKASLSDGTIDGVEALLRWQQQNGEFIRPDMFIPFAEQSGLMRSLTTFVLEEAIQQLATWQRAGIPLRMAVNISARDLHDEGLPEQVGALLDDAGVDPATLELEITEHSIMSDPVRASAVLARLRALGVRIAMDDFGTGNTSLGQLPQLPIDVLKIDRSFIMNLSGTAEDVIVRTIIDLGHELDLQVVAEGVSSPALWDRLAGLGCDVAQGYFISKPVSVTDLELWLATSGRR